MTFSELTPAEVHELARYIAEYMREEQRRHQEVTENTYVEAIDAFIGGAR